MDLVCQSVSACNELSYSNIFIASSMVLFFIVWVQKKYDGRLVMMYDLLIWELNHVQNFEIPLKL